MPVQSTSIEVNAGNRITYSSSETWVIEPSVLVSAETGHGIASTFNGSVLSNSGHIVSGESFAVSMTGLNDSINNTGSIFGDVVLGQGGDLYDGRGGIHHGTVFGAGGRDTLLGGGEDDFLHGGKGRDVLRGGGGDDLVKGGAGKDKLDGGRGKDKLHGGPDADQFVFGVTPKPKNADVIRAWCDQRDAA